MQPFKVPAVWQGVSDVICVLINEKLSFQVARPMAAIQFERDQEGHLSLAARWPGAKPVEEPRSLHPVTGTWSGAPEQPPVSFSLTRVHTQTHVYMSTHTQWITFFVSSVKEQHHYFYTFIVFKGLGISLQHNTYIGMTPKLLILHILLILFFIYYTFNV